MRSISLSKLLKTELPELVTSVIRTVEKHDPQSLHLDGVLQMLKHSKTQIDTLEVPYGPHPLTNRINKLHQKQLEYAGSISDQMQAIARIDLMGAKKEVKIANLMVRRHLIGLRKNNQRVVSIILDQFFDKLDEELEVSDALRSIGLQLYIDELRRIHTEYKRLYDERDDSLAERQKAKESKQIQKDGQGVLRGLLEQVDLAQKTYKHLDYEPLITELDVILASYTNLIKTRATYNKKRAVAKAKAIAEAQSKVHILSVNGKETGSVIIDREKKERNVKSAVKKEKRGNQPQKNKTTLKAEKLKNRDVDDSAHSEISKKQQKGDNLIGGLLNILKLPPGGDS